MVPITMAYDGCAPMKVLVSMGDSTDEGLCRVVAVDVASERADTVFSWLPPPRLRTAGKGFLGLAWGGVPGRLLACAHAAICRIDTTSWTLDGVLHQPCMNDLHDVAVDQRGRLIVANTGSDRIDVFESDGTFVGGWDLAPAWVLAERMRGANPSRASWRRALAPGWDAQPCALADEPFAEEDASAASTERPYSSRKTRDFVHPSHVALVGDRPIVTRFLDRSIQDLGSWTRVVSETPGYPHDGNVFDDRFWITCTNGKVVAYALEGGTITPREVERLDVFDRAGRCGWCRGLAISETLMVVGLSRLRRTANTRWIERAIEDSETSILAFDRSSSRLVARVDLGAFGGFTKIFAVLPTASF
jgi:hypothetical protein